MRSLGLDVGGRRTGVAISDSEGILATPLTVLASQDEDALIKGILTLIEQHKIRRVVVGLPRRLSGELGRQASRVTAFVNRLSWQARQSNLDEFDIQLWDERLSTKAAERLKARTSRRRDALHFRAKKGARKQDVAIKAEVDAIAAALILQGFLDSLRPGDGEES